jgi:hypothetical protein
VTGFVEERWVKGLGVVKNFGASLCNPHGAKGGDGDPWCNCGAIDLNKRPFLTTHLN